MSPLESGNWSSAFDAHVSRFSHVTLNHAYIDRAHFHGLAGTHKMAGVGVPQLLQSLCDCIVEERQTAQRRAARESVPFPLPNHLHQTCCSNPRAVSRHLYRTAMELLLLRRRDWYGRWQSSLSPESRCLAVSFLLHQLGRHEEGDRLSTAVAKLTAQLGESSLPVLELLAILSNMEDSRGQVS